MGNDRIMSVRAIVALVSIGLIGLVGYLFFDGVYKDISPPQSNQADTYSRSAIGHWALYNFAEGLDIPVQRARQFTEAAVGWNGLLVMAEPRLGDTVREDVVRKAQRTRSLVVLPKRYGLQDRQNPDFVRTVQPISQAQLVELLEELIPGSKLLHPDSTVEVVHDEGRFAPVIAGLQLIDLSGADGNVTPLLYNHDGVLLAQVSRGLGRFFVLSDPDLLANHGLHEGENAEITAWILAQTLPAGGNLVFDEVIHGFKASPNVWILLFSPPYLIISLMFLATLVLLVWSGLTRFGKPETEPSALPRGAEALITNTAGMLSFSGHGGEILTRYLELSRREVAEALHAPKDMNAEQLTEWLDQIGAAKKNETSLRLLTAEVSRDAERMPVMQQLKTGIRIHTWKTELIHGSG